MQKPKLSIDELATFCKRKGFVYPSAEIYGGIAGFYDFGHLGVELKNNIKNEWWKKFVNERGDVVGIDGSIVTNPAVWKASGHIDGFIDVIVDCKKCGMRYRGDHLIEGIFKCQKCNSELSEPKKFNLMFATNIGPVQQDSSVSYLRPETAQLIFTNFKLVQENARLKLPFGIAQIGKAFRNEVSPRDFLFRMREFEQMEIEYFVHPEKTDDCPCIDEVEDFEFNVLTEEMQKHNKRQAKMKIKEILNKKIIKAKWHAYWLALMTKWFIELGANQENFRIRQHIKSELSHYASDTWDIEYKFPFGWKELQGIANRSDYDLKQHSHHSKNDLSLFDEESKKKILPYVICEPSQGVERAFLVFMLDAYTYDKKRENVVLRLHPKLAPIKVAVFPLVNKEELINLSKQIEKELRKQFNVFYDQSGSVGRRYARQDEIGTPYCVTVDFDSLKDKKVTIRNRDDTKQARVKVGEVKEKIRKLVSGELKFEQI